MKSYSLTDAAKKIMPKNKQKYKDLVDMLLAAKIVVVEHQNAFNKKPELKLYYIARLELEQANMPMFEEVYIDTPVGKKYQLRVTEYGIANLYQYMLTKINEEGDYHDEL